MTKTEKKKVLWYLILIVVVSVAFSVWGTRLDPKVIETIVQKAGLLGPLVFILLITLCQVFAPVSGTPIFFAGYLMFNNRVQFYNYLAYLIASYINFTISRKWGRRWVIKLVGRDDMSRVDSFTKSYGVKSLIFLRVFQGYLSDFISYAYGLTNISFKKYFVVSIFAPIPWLLFWHLFIFPRTENLIDFSLWFLITLVPLFVISWFYWKYLNRT